MNMRRSNFLHLMARITIIVIIVTSLYIALAPIFPEIEYWLDSVINVANASPLDGDNLSAGADQKENETSGEKSDVENTLQGINRIVIEKAKVDVAVVEGYTEESLSKGAWRLPNSAVPGQIGNVVITAHRFQYILPTSQTFYNLDKLAKGDAIVLYWEGKRFEYIVSELFETEPNNLSVEEDKGDNRLTLYTCTPLWTSTSRLVVVAFPVEISNNPAEE